MGLQLNELVGEYLRLERRAILGVGFSNSARLFLDENPSFREEVVKQVKDHYRVLDIGVPDLEKRNLRSKELYSELNGIGLFYLDSVSVMARSPDYDEIGVSDIARMFGFFMDEHVLPISASIFSCVKEGIMEEKEKIVRYYHLMPFKGDDNFIDNFPVERYSFMLYNLNSNELKQASEAFGVLSKLKQIRFS